MSTAFTYDNSGCACSRKSCKGCKIYEAHKEPITNADRIRIMTDEELAKLFKDFRHGHKYPFTYDGWIEWLKQGDLDNEHTN